MEQTHLEDKCISLIELADILKTRKERDAGKAAILLGAGASLSAGIPLAKGIVEEVRKIFPRIVKECKPTYAAYMDKLDPVDRKSLLKNLPNSERVAPPEFHCLFGKTTIAESPNLRIFSDSCVGSDTILGIMLCCFGESASVKAELFRE